jgi:hypothetical protein
MTELKYIAAKRYPSPPPSRKGGKKGFFAKEFKNPRHLCHLCHSLGFSVG